MPTADTVEWDEFDEPDAEPSAEWVARIARYQRWLIGVVLAQLVLWCGFIALLVIGGGRGPGINLPLALTVILGCVGGIFVFLLSWELRGTFAALVFGAATVVPCLGLIVLTLVNGYATNELRNHGKTVGVFGAKAARVGHRPSLYDADDAGW